MGLCPPVPAGRVHESIGAIVKRGRKPGYHDDWLLIFRQAERETLSNAYENQSFDYCNSSEPNSICIAVARQSA
jgi:hypothetical protein